MRHLLAALAAPVLLALPASAQLIAVHFKDDKAANKYKERLVLFAGRPAVVGEAWSNLQVDLEKSILGRADGNNSMVELLCPDPADPAKVPFKIDGDDRKITNGKCKVGINIDHISGFSFYSRENSLLGLAAEYTARKSAVDELLAARDAKPTGGPEWMAGHQRMLQQMQRLHSWLQSGLFPEAAAKFEKELAKERKVVASEAVTVRRESAKASVKTIEVPEKLVQVAAEIEPGTKFGAQESRHCRIIYREGIDDLRVKDLLVLAEEIIDGFRVDFVDPYLDTAYEDYIPEKIVTEWFLGPEDSGLYERYLTLYFRFAWDAKRKEELLKMSGTTMFGSGGVDFRHLCRISDNDDLEGRIAHNLGHDLSNLHFNRGRGDMNQDWLEEGVGLYVSLEWLGRNSITCKAWDDPARGRYVNEDKNKKTEGTKTVQLGLRDYFNTLALEAGAPIDKMALKTLFEMSDGDLAKSWSFYDWIAKKTGKEGQMFLRACCKTSHAKATFITDWRAKAEEILSVTGKDVFDVVDARWKEFAQAGQDTGDTRKR
jgi:hypothetical protein